VWKKGEESQRKFGYSMTQLNTQKEGDEAFYPSLKVGE